MSSDRQQYREALWRWDTLRVDKAYSIPAEIGTVAIVCSYQRGAAPIGWSQALRTQYVNPQDPRRFRKEALTLADRLRIQDRKSEVILDAKSNDLQAVLRDPSISDVIVIGHGSLSTLSIGDSQQANTYSWRDVSKDADHLKTGQFTQRSCGNYVRQLAVPLGLFAVNDHRNVIAPVGYYFAPTSLDHPHNQLLGPVSDTERLIYAAIKRLFPANQSEVIPPIASASS